MRLPQDKRERGGFHCLRIMDERHIDRLQQLSRSKSNEASKLPVLQVLKVYRLLCFYCYAGP